MSALVWNLGTPADAIYCRALADVCGVNGVAAPALLFHGTDKAESSIAGIHLNRDWMRSVCGDRPAPARWILGHELCHQLGGQPQGTVERELAADRYAGRTLAMLGNHESVIEGVLRAITVDQRPEYPSFDRRWAASRDGYRNGGMLGAFSGPWSPYDKAVAADPAGVEAVLQVADALGLSRRELAWVIQNESGWNPAARAPTTDASGLTQFLPSTLRSLGYLGSAADFRSLSRGEQAPWIRKLYTGRKIPRGDLYLANYWPAGVGKSDDYVIAEPHDAAYCVDHPKSNWCANKGLRESPTGPITAGSVRRKGTPPSSGGPSEEAPPVTSMASVAGKSGSIVPWLVGAAAVAAAVAYYRR